MFIVLRERIETYFAEFVVMTQHDDHFRSLLIHHLPEVSDCRRQRVLGGDHLRARCSEVLGTDRGVSVRNSKRVLGGDHLRTGWGEVLGTDRGVSVRNSKRVLGGDHLRTRCSEVLGTYRGVSVIHSTRVT